MSDYEVFPLDLNFQGESKTIASYLIVGPEGPLLIETGPGSVLTTHLEQLAHHGYQPTDIQQVLVTHIHFDHAGAAGWWAQQGATVYVHYFGARHLISPERLIASAGRIYGDQMGPLWGDILPAPADKVVALHDKETVSAGGLTFEVIETPGHALHHHVYKLGDIAFTGDAAGMKLGGYELLDIPAPPPEFDLEAWLTTIDTLQTYNFQTIYPTHFGPVQDVQTHLTEARALIEAAALFIKQQLDKGAERDEIVTAYTAWNRARAQRFGLAEAAIRKYEVTNPWYMSVDGILRYWRKQAASTER